MGEMTEEGNTHTGRPWLKLALPALVVLTIGIGAFVSRDIWRWYFVSGDVTQEVPDAPTLSADTPGQTLFRIDTTRSTASYSVREHLAGIDRTAVGTTEALAGDIVVDSDDPSLSTVGTVVINVEMLQSDSSLRDKRIRHDFLESGTYRFAQFAPAAITGLPDEIVEGQAYEIRIDGDLTVKATTAEAVFSGQVTIADGELKASMVSTVKMSTFDIGPISISGLVSTSDDVTLTLDLTAVDVAEGGAAAGTPIGDRQVDNQVIYDPNAAGDFASSVMPILADNCASCHNAGGVGASTWALNTAGDAGQVASGIAVVTGSAYMPPWPASDAGVALHDSWKLSQSDIDTLAGWAASGGAIDVPPETPIVAPERSLSSIDHDVLMRANEPYAGSAAHADDYRCQIFDPNLQDPSWVTGLEFMPDQVAVVHHSVVYHADASLRSAAEAVDAADPGPGWTCYGLTGIHNGAKEPEQIMAWAPGQQPEVMPAGTGIPFQPGDFVIAQVHYHYEHDFPLDQSRLALALANDGEIASAGGSLAPISHHVFVAPAEIPCSPDQSGPMCDRNNVLARLERDFGSGGGPDGILRSCGQSLADVAVLVDGVARGLCDSSIDGSAEVISVFGHMHEFGETFRMTLNPGRPDEQILLDIPNWSFEWQFNYLLEQPVAVKRGDTLRVECSWNRARVEQAEPAYVTWSDGTADEMCYSVVATRPS